MLTDANYLASLPPRKRLASFLQQPRIVLEAAVESLDAGQVSPPQEALTPVELAPPVPKRKRTERKAGGPAPGTGSQMAGGESLVAAALSKALALRLVAQQAYVRAAELRQVRHGDKEIGALVLGPRAYPSGHLSCAPTAWPAHCSFVLLSQQLNTNMPLCLALTYTPWVYCARWPTTQCGLPRPVRGRLRSFSRRSSGKRVQQWQRPCKRRCR